MSSGADQIRAERGRQIVSEGYSVEYDLTAGGAEPLALAAYGYVAHAAGTILAGFTPEQSLEAGEFAGPTPDAWPWSAEAWKPTGDPKRDLVKAGALIAAAIDQLDLAERAKTTPDTRGFDFRGVKTPETTPEDEA
jgi:hypothetical protein